MAYELRQELRLTQNLVMTPQLQLAIRLLQLSRIELVETIKEELQANPVLEETADTDAPAEAPAEPPAQEIDWQSYFEQESSYSGPSVNFNEREDGEDTLLGNIPSLGGGLKDHLLWQLNMSGLAADEAAVGEFIIGNIDEDGYLRLVDRGEMTDDELDEATMTAVMAHTGADRSAAEKALLAIQNLDPPGAGSRNLRECLLHQARLLPVRDTVVEEIISSHLERLASRNLKAIARDLGVSPEEVLDAACLINRCLNPTPGAGFGADESRAIVPDVFIHKVGDEYVITLNEDGMPKLRVSRYYKDLLRADGAASEQAKGYIQDKLKSALWLIKSVHQRQRTIYKVVECIVKFQKGFLDRGLKYLKPLVLKDVAEVIDVHESTVSRVTSNKYVQTPRGIFELKYFFGGSVAGSVDGDITAEYIKARIRDILKGEDPKSPLSDQQIVEKLKEEGIGLARRTAAKYRESLGFLSSSRRKVHF
ncbi:MAG: RNA polymerase factor sigma-54 [Thermodesulfobacteriota bacterium]